MTFSQGKSIINVTRYAYTPLRLLGSVILYDLRLLRFRSKEDDGKSIWNRRKGVHLSSNVLGIYFLHFILHNIFMPNESFKQFTSYPWPKNQLQGQLSHSGQWKMTTLWLSSPEHDWLTQVPQVISSMCQHHGLSVSTFCTRDHFPVPNLLGPQRMA